MPVTPNSRLSASAVVLILFTIRSGHIIGKISKVSM
jgi:hypothetical protein